MHMTEVRTADGPIETSLPAEAVADLQQPEATPQEPEKTPETKPEPTAKPEQPEKPAEAKAEEPKPEPADEKPQEHPTDSETGKFSRKAKPIADLLAKNHDLTTQLEAERKAKADLEAKLAEIGQQPAGAASTADIKSLAQKHGLDEIILTDIVNAARAGFKTELPPEVQQLLKEREESRQVEAETKAFNLRVDGLAKTLKDEQLTDPKVREKLMKLAYSTDKAPDGEPYHQKELAELYFGFIKPEIEPGKPSAEPSRGGSQAGPKVMDFQEVFDRDDPKDIEAMDDATFKKYHAWLSNKQGDVPIRKHK